ncbi:Cyclic nucleotide-binding domain-containing protein 2 [Podochytrium sp. JEL0797]|nr:Cyclic nucleotide-binding domain-containing protein 2 [Podochytrium sp. JEL0797]
MFRLVALASHFTKYLSKILKNPVQWGWEYDPDANFAEEVANPGVSKSESTRNVISAVDFAVGHLFSKHSFEGWMTPTMRRLFRKPPEIRTELELSEMQQWSSSMKAFRKVPASIQREFLRVGRYERWHSERMIIGEGQRGMYFYIILDGEIEMFKMDREGMERDKLRKSKSLLSLAGSRSNSTESVNDTKKANADDYERKYRVPLGSQSSGESFGDMAFDGGRRIASAVTKRTTEFLLIERDDYLRIAANMGNDQSRDILKFLKKIPVFKTLSANPETIAHYCDLKVYPPESVVVSEGEPCEYLYFQRTGTSRLVKSLMFAKIMLHNGNHHIEPINVIPLVNHEAQPHFPHALSENHLLAASLPPNSTLVTKFVVTQKLNPGDYYFDGSENINPNDLAFSTGARAITAKTSVITTLKSEFLVISKIDFSKFATRETWKEVSKGTMEKALPPLPLLTQVYVENRKWDVHKKKVVAEIMADIRRMKAK